MILGIQIFGVLFGLFMLYLTFLHSKRKEFTIKESSFWIILWVAFILIVLLPNSLDFLIKEVLNISRRLDFFIIIGFMLLTGIIFYTYTIVRKNQKRLEAVVRKIAIEKKIK